MKSVVGIIIVAAFTACGVLLAMESGLNLQAFVELVKNPPKHLLPSVIGLSLSGALMVLYLLVVCRRAFVALGAVLLFTYCALKLYVIADGNVEKIVNAIVSPVTPKELLLVVGAVVSLVVIIYIALRTSKVIVTQDEKFDALERQLADATAWISAREGKHEKAAHLKTEYVALMARRAALSDPSSGLSALMRQLTSLRGEHDSEVGALMLNGDAVRVFDQLPAHIEEARTLLGKIEQAVIALPQLKVQVDELVSRAATLEEGRAIRVSDIDDLHQKLNGLSDEGGDGKIANLNEGHSDYAGTFTEQVADLVEKANTIEKPLGEIEAAAAKLLEIKTRETAFQARVKRLESARDGVIALIRSLRKVQDQAARILEELEKLDQVPAQISQIRRSLAQEAIKAGDVKAVG